MPIPHGNNKRNAIRNSIKKLCLSTAFISTLSAPSIAQQIVADGTLVTVPKDTIVDTSGQDSTAGYGLFALNAGTITATDISVLTNGFTAHGLEANGRGSSIVLNGGKIEVQGDQAYGVSVIDGARVQVNNVEILTHQLVGHGVYADGSGSNASIAGSRINTLGEYAWGVAAFNGATAYVESTEINTSGGYSYGLIAENQSTLTAVDVSIKTQGDYAHGARSVSLNSAINIEHANIETTGNVAFGARAEGGGAVSISNSVISTAGNSSYGLDSTGSGSVLHASNVVINTSGTDFDGTTASGAVSEFGGRLILQGAKITIDGANAMGLLSQSRGTAFDDPTVLSATNAEILTSGNFGHGAVACSMGVGASAECAGAVDGQDTGIEAPQVLLQLANSTIDTTGAGSYGVLAKGAGASLELRNVGITTTGAGSHGAFASSGGTATITDSTVNTNGDGSHGLSAQDGSSVTATDTTVQTAGPDSAGVYLSDNSTAVLNHSSIVTLDGPALQTGSGTVSYELTNGTFINGNGTLLLAAADSNTTLTADGNVSLSGDIVAESSNILSDTVIDVSLSNSSRWQGAAKGVTSAAIDGTSYWQMTGSSDVGSLSNDGTVEFDAANPYKTLTVGTLDVNGGSFILNTKLNDGGASSETDKVVVTGDANGSGLINIRNNGGAGAVTGTGVTDGIQVVQVGGASDADFQLGSAAIVGIYDYQLVKADGQNWYLQTEGSDVVDGGGENPGGGTGNPGTGHVVDIVPGYNIALSAAQNHVLTSLDTFHERLGELRAEELNDGYHAWMRGIGKTGSYSPKSVTGYNGHGFDMTTAGVQIGADYSKSDVFVAGDKLTIGIFGEYANSSFDVRGRTADGSISSKGLGGYVTWQQKAPTDRKPGTGAYVDAVVKQDWLEFGVNAKSVSGFDLQNGYKGKATTASIETGYGFDLGNNVVLQPQAQLTWSKVKADSFTDSYGIAVHGQEAESLIGRVGVRLEKTFYFGDEEETVEAAPVPMQKAQKQVKGKKGKSIKVAPADLPEAPKKKKFVKSVTTYADANVKREFKGKNGLVASNTGIGNDMGGTRADIGVGVVARVSENVSLFGRGSVEFGGSTNVAGKVSGGLKITW